MAKNQPWSKWFWDDYHSDQNLRVCSLASRGLWMECLRLMHKCGRRGYLQQENGQPYTQEQIARIAGCTSEEVAHLMQELLSSGVASVSDTGTIFNRRMVKEEHISKVRSEAGKKGGLHTVLLKQNVKQTPSKGSSKVQAAPWYISSKREEKEENISPLGDGGVGEGVCSSKIEAKPAAPPFNPGFHPMVLPEAKRVLAYYERQVTSAHASGNHVVSRITQIIVEQKVSAQELCRAIDLYREKCERNKHGPEMRLGPTKFFGEDVWRPLLEAPEKPTEPAYCFDDEIQAAMKRNAETRARLQTA